MTLDQFNQQVLTCQDEAFTLAVALVADEKLACKMVQESILQVYGKDGNDEPIIAVKVLQCVILSCRQASAFMWGGVEEYVPGWNQLESDEQEALLLVDVLGKPYQCAALILKCSDWNVTRLVARGRCKLAMGFNLESEQHD
jgi:predicted DNA-binding protein (UPF0251 family)